MYASQGDGSERCETDACSVTVSACVTIRQTSGVRRARMHLEAEAALMELGDLISLNGVIPQLRARNKKQALLELAVKAAEITGINSGVIYETILQRERLGSTGLGRGIAIPHGRLSRLDHVVTVFARLDVPIDFDAIDGEPVDLLFLLLTPEQAGADHLKALARISRVLRDPHTTEKLRASRDRAVLYAVLTEPAASHAA